VPKVDELATTGSESFGPDLTCALDRMRRWGERCDWTGWDPYDGLNSRTSRALTLGTSFGRRVVLQAVKASPVNVRPLLGIRPARNQKAIGLVASGYGYLGACGDEAAALAATRLCEWLVAGHVGGPAGCAWGYHFDVQTRFFAYPAGSPNTIATTFVGHALLDVAERLGDLRWVEPVVDAGRYLVGTMLVERDGATYFRYIPDDDKLIHNANLLACALLVRIDRLLQGNSLRPIAESAVAASLGAQRPDGSFPYSDWSSQGWVDNFHTGYVLESLAACGELPGVRAPLERGVAYWERELFLADGRPKYYASRVRPEDGHCYAQAIDTWLALDQMGLPRRREARRMAALLIDRMLSRDGTVVFRRRRLLSNRVPFVRWTTAPSFRALARLAWVLSRSVP
jgi:hypothetical protein